MPHFAITIGPIYRTFQQVRKTRELWAASWLFSFLSKRLIEKLKDLDDSSIYVPYYSKATPVGIGLYPDRIFLQSDKITLERIEQAKNDVFAEIAKVLDAVDDKTSSLTFLKDYFRVYTVQYNIADKENPVLAGNQLLDTAELRDPWQLEESVNPLLRFFRNVNKVKIDGKNWIKDNLEEKDIFGQVRFESVMEIATRAIRENVVSTYNELVRKYCYTDQGEDVDENEDNFITELKAALNKDPKKEVFKNYHKYVCVLKADGDRVGKYIKAIQENIETELAEVSKNLYEWGIDTHNLIKDYKGVTIYVGGDDVMALLPVVGANGKNIIELCERINKSFQERFAKELKDEAGKPIKPTLSFGASITYYKFPLNEALQKADALLYKAKETRNTLALSLLKHSGASFDMQIIYGDADKYQTGEAFNKLLPHFANEENYVSSLIHHFREHEPVYRTIAGDAKRISNYLRFNFDDKKHEELVTCAVNLVNAQQQKHHIKPNDETASRAAMEETYSMLRTIKFLNGHDDGK